MKKYRIIFCASLGLIFIASDLFAVVFGDPGVYRLLTGLFNAVVIMVIGWSGFGLGAAFTADNAHYNNRNLVTWSLVTWVVASILFRFTYEPDGSIIFAIFPPLLAVFVLAFFAGKSGSDLNSDRHKDTQT